MMHLNLMAVDLLSAQFAPAPQKAAGEFVLQVVVTFVRQKAPGRWSLYFPERPVVVGVHLILLLRSIFDADESSRTRSILSCNVGSILLEYFADATFLFCRDGSKKTPIVEESEAVELLTDVVGHAVMVVDPTNLRVIPTNNFFYRPVESIANVRRFSFPRKVSDLARNHLAGNPKL